MTSDANGTRIQENRTPEGRRYWRRVAQSGSVLPEWANSRLKKNLRKEAEIRAAEQGRQLRPEEDVEIDRMREKLFLGILDDFVGQCASHEEAARILKLPVEALTALYNGEGWDEISLVELFRLYFRAGLEVEVKIKELKPETSPQ